MKNRSVERKESSHPTPSPTSTSPATRDQARGTTGFCHKPGHAQLPSNTPKAPRPEQAWRPSPSHVMFPAPMLPSDTAPPLSLTLPFSFLRLTAQSPLHSALHYPQGMGSRVFFPASLPLLLQAPESQACPSQTEHIIFSISSLIHKENLLSIKRPSSFPPLKP